MRRPVESEAPEHRHRARPGCPIEDVPVATLIDFVGQEVQHRPVVPDIEDPPRRVIPNIGIHPLHWRRVVPQPFLRDAQRRGRHVHHGEIVVAAREQVIDQTRCPATDVDDAGGGVHPGGVDHPQRHHRFGFEPAARRLALGVGAVPVGGQLGVGHSH